jgi:hypothetical protein
LKEDLQNRNNTILKFANQKDSTGQVNLMTQDCLQRKFWGGKMKVKLKDSGVEICFVGSSQLIVIVRMLASSDWQTLHCLQSLG